MAGIKLVTETKEQDVALLKDVDAEFVSLVRHGANRMPFRVIKQEKGGVDKSMSLIIQSILLPTGVKLENVAAKKGLEFLTDASSEVVQEFGEYSKLEQLPLERFEKESVRLLKFGDNAWALVGKVSNGVDIKNALTLSESQLAKVSTLPQAPIDAALAPDVAVQQAIAPSFRDLFERELSSMLDIVYGSLKQTTTDAGKRKKMIITAVDSFRKFLTVGLDAIGGTATKMESKSGGGERKEGGSENMDLFKDENEFVEKVTSIITGVLDKKFPAKTEDEEAAAKKAAAEKEAADKKKALEDAAAAGKKTGDGPDVEKQLSELTESVKGLSETVKTVVQKTEDLGSQLQTTPGSQDDDDLQRKQKKEDDEDESNVFAGLLTRKKAA